MIVAKDIWAHAPEIYADLVDALDALRRNEKVGGSSLGAGGFSTGGYFAVRLAATGEVRAGVSYYSGPDFARIDPALSRFRAVFTSDSAPVLLLFGTADPGARVIPRIRPILNAVHSPYEISLYPDARHLFERDLSTAANQAAAGRRHGESRGSRLSPPIPDVSDQLK